MGQEEGWGVEGMKMGVLISSKVLFADDTSCRGFDPFSFKRVNFLVFSSLIL